MGQRHQAFLIARIVPKDSTDNKPLYRCIGAIHHQWCYGSLPLSATHSFIKLSKNRINASIMRQEISALHGQELSKTPCPYSTVLLACAFNVAIDKNYCNPSGPFRRSILPATMACWYGDNDEGITVIDITDPLNPAYAFASSPGQDSFTAEKYIRVYYPGTDADEKDMEEYVKELIATFDSVPVIPRESLAEAWPGEFGAQTDPVPTEMEATPQVVPSLVDSMIEPAVLQSLDSGDTTGLEIVIPAKATQMKAILCSRKPFPDTGFPLLVAVLQQELKQNPTLDISGFSFSVDQLCSLVLKFPDVRNINLSHSPDLQVDHLRALLTSKPQIDHLELLDTGITTEAIESLLSSDFALFKKTSDILHPFFYSNIEDDSAQNFSNFAAFYSGAPSRAECKTLNIFNVFACEGREIRCQGIASIGIPLWTPKKMIQNLVDLVGFVASPYKSSCFFGQSMVLESVLCAGLRDPGVEWSDRPMTMTPGFSPRGLNQEGWTFLLREVPVGGSGKPRLKYAFVKEEQKRPIGPNAHAQIYGTPLVVFKAYDVRGFLEEVEKEGRGPLPEIEMVRKFEQLVRNGTVTEIAEGVVSEGNAADVEPSSADTVFTDPEVREFMRVKFVGF